MKKNIFAILALLLIAGSISGQKKVDIEKEKEAIEAVIKKLVNDRSEWDFESYIDAWVDEPYSFISWAGKEGQEFIYWNDWKKQGKEIYAKELQAEKEGGYSMSIEPVDISIKVYKEVAWAHFKNKWTKVLAENEVTEDMGETFIILSLEKRNGDWKIAYLSAVISYSYVEEGPGEK